VVRTLPRDAKATASLVIASPSGIFEHENDIILTSCHIAADQSTAQSRDLGLEVFVSRVHTFDRFRALVGPIQVADEKHGSPPFSEYNTPWQKRHASLECIEPRSIAKITPGRA
jgi:hypothetical protein